MDYIHFSEKVGVGELQPPSPPASYARALGVIANSCLMALNGLKHNGTQTISAH